MNTQIRQLRRFTSSAGMGIAPLLEKGLLLNAHQSSRPQLFILGLPRSGTTLIYQYLVHRLQVAYFTNGVGNYPMAPCLTTFLQSKLHGAYASDFRSRYGKVTGPVAPREAGGFWGRFFRLDDYVRFDDIAPEHIRELRRTIACVQHNFGDAPFVNKNVKHMLRIDALARIFPNAYFLIVGRDINAVALSVLRGRHENLDHPEKWWSVKSPNYETLKDLPPAEQVARQLPALKAKLSADLSGVSAERVLTVGYETFCDQPESLVARVREVLKPLDFRNSPEQSFTPSANNPRTPEELRLIELLEHADN
ncbi:MAG: sulfotransferase [Nitrococcus sp.]|nr:sulfotransferase [Nitrococcus sp.]